MVGDASNDDSSSELSSSPSTRNTSYSGAKCVFVVYALLPLPSLKFVPDSIRSSSIGLRFMRSVSFKRRSGVFSSTCSGCKTIPLVTPFLAVRHCASGGALFSHDDVLSDSLTLFDIFRFLDSAVTPFTIPFLAGFCVLDTQVGGGSFVSIASPALTPLPSQLDSMSESSSYPFVMSNRSNLCGIPLRDRLGIRPFAGNLTIPFSFGVVIEFVAAAAAVAVVAAAAAFESRIKSSLRLVKSQIFADKFCRQFSMAVDRFFIGVVSVCNATATPLLSSMSERVFCDDEAPSWC